MGVRSAFSNELTEHAMADPRVVLLTGDHGYALFDQFRKKCRPEQFINAGVAEQNMVGVASGLAKRGYRPIVYGLASFVPMRVLEQIRIDVCYDQQPVIFIGDGAGLVYSTLGVTHQCCEDIGALRPLPNLQIFSPCDSHEMTWSFRTAFASRTASYLRMGRDRTEDVHRHPILRDNPGLSMVRDGGDRAKILVMATGSMVQSAIHALESDSRFSVMSVCRLSPVDATVIDGILGSYRGVITVEEHNAEGGLGSLMAEHIAERGRHRLLRIGTPRVFASHAGSYDYLLEQAGLSTEHLRKRIGDWVGRLEMA